MATASSAQREPSMEEILASIRRIIEDSDTGRKPEGDVADLRQDFESEPVGEVYAPEVDVFRAELRAGPSAVKPVSLAEVQAQLEAEQPQEHVGRHAPDAGSPTISLADIGTLISQGSSSESDESSDARTMTSWQRDISTASRLADVVAPEPRAPEVQADEESEAAGAGAEDAPEAWLRETGTPGSAGAATAAPFEAQAIRPALVSEQTSRQVAAAFGELSEAFASRSRRTFDEMAEQMLRPMLQDWLDNNLPALVERLVREEIERVARGA